MSMSVPELQDYQQQTTSFDAFGWFRAGRYHLTAPGEPQFVPGAAVTPALARQLGPPLLGQWFADDSSAVISSALWRRLGGGRDIIGSAITLDERRYTVSGVMPPAFRLPVAGTGDDTRRHRGVDSPRSVAARREPGQRHRYFAYARRKPGVSLEQAQADAKRVATNIAADGSRSGIRSTRRAWPTCASRRSGSQQRPRHAADPARRRRAPAAHRLRQRGHAAAGAIRRPRPRDGDPRRARRVAAPARAALLRRRRARLGRRRRRRRRSERDLRPADPGRRVRIRPACR